VCAAGRLNHSRTCTTTAGLVATVGAHAQLQQLETAGGNVASATLRGSAVQVPADWMCVTKFLLKPSCNRWDGPDPPYET
jgi:hypothetical protein